MFGRVLPANPTLADRFSWFLWVVINQMALEGRRRGIGQALETAIQRRILGLWKRLRSVLARWEAGTLTAARGRKAAKGNATPQESTPHPDPPPQGGRETNGELRAQRGAAVWGKLPRGFGWLGRLLPTVERTAFLPLVNDPEMRAIFERAPQVGRILRPWCQVFGLEMPEWLRLPKRVRARRSGLNGAAGAVAPPSPSPIKGEGEVVTKRRRRTPREVAADAIRESERTGKPIDPKKIGAVAFGYTLHWPRDGNCPPPEIGYGGRRRKPPKDYRPPKDWE